MAKDDLLNGLRTFEKFTLIDRGEAFSEKSTLILY